MASESHESVEKLKERISDLVKRSADKLKEMQELQERIVQLAARLEAEAEANENFQSHRRGAAE
jgi:prefoldin subunit 5